MHEESDPIVVGLIAAPGAPARVAAQVRDELAGDLARRYPEVRWRVPIVQDGLVEPGAAGLDMVERGRERLLAEDWDFEETLGHAVGPLDYARLSWLIASLATVGGALGAGIEQTDRVREAAYAFRPDERVEEGEA